MLKKGIVNSLICMALILLSIAIIDGVTDSCWEDMYFYSGILLMGLLFSIWQIILKHFDIKYYKLEILINFVVTLGIALLLGKIFQWYSDIHNIIYVCLEVLLVFIVGYVLGLVKTKHELNQINVILRNRKNDSSSTYFDLLQKEKE